MTGEGTSEKRAKVLPLWFLQAVTVYWIALKSVGLFIGDPHADEAFYFIWGQHPALSYFDHAPFHAWLQGLMGLLFGWSLFGLRFLSIVTTAITMYLLYLWAKRFSQEDWQRRFWTSTALFYSAPLMLLYTTIAIHDRILVAMELLSIHFFVWFLIDWSEGKRDRHAALYLGALFLGLATLTKYNGALVGAGIALAILVRGDLRSLFRNPHLYLAAALSVLMQFPVIYWNLTESLASVQLHLGSTHANPFDIARFNTGGLTVLTLESIALLSPVAIFGMAVFAIRPAASDPSGIFHSVAKWIFLVSTAFVVFLSLTRYVLFYWNIVGYAAFFSVAAMFIRNRIAQTFQIVYGVVLATVLTVHFSVFPVLQTIGIQTPRSDGFFGWHQVADEVREAQELYGAEFAAAVTWGVATRLGFALGRADVPAITDTIDAYDFWVDKADYAGKDAIIAIEPGDDPFLDEARAHFDSIEPVETFWTEQYGVKLREFRLFLARNYHAD